MGGIRFALSHPGDHVGTPDPVCFGQVGLRPLRGVIRVRMIKADDVFVACASFALDADQFPGVDVIAVLRGIGTRIPAAGGGGDGTNVAVHLAQQNPTTFVGIGFFSMSADFGVILMADF